MRRGRGTWRYDWTNPVSVTSLIIRLTRACKWSNNNPNYTRSVTLSRNGLQNVCMNVKGFSVTFTLNNRMNVRHRSVPSDLPLVSGLPVTVRVREGRPQD